jgi:hypothetical protein
LFGYFIWAHPCNRFEEVKSGEIIINSYLSENLGVYTEYSLFAASNLGYPDLTIRNRAVEALFE